MKNLFNRTLVSLLALVSSAVAQPNLTPKLVDEVAVNGNLSAVATSTTDTTKYVVTMWADYVALGDRSINAQVWDENLNRWEFMAPVQTVEAGRGSVKFTYLVAKNSGWGQTIVAYGDVYPVQVGVVMYDGTTTKAACNGNVYGK